MKILRVLREYAEMFAFGVCVLPAITKTCEAQQGRPPFMQTFQTRNEAKLDPSLPWMSEYRPPFIYQVWWREIADCEGLKIPPDSLKQVQYFQVNAPSFVPEDVPYVVYAVTYENGQTFVAEPYIWNESLVKHEFLHTLLRWAGDPLWYEHDPKRFMSCGLRIAGEPPDNQ